MYDYDDFYREPSEFELQVDEFKESLIKAVKEEYQSEMERLRKENSELQATKKRMTEIEREHENKMRELKLEKRNLLATVRRERLSELLRDNFGDAWMVKAVNTKKPKCNKCNENRYLTYKSPRGVEKYESCECAESDTHYEPVKTECYHFERYVGRSGEAKVVYYYEDESDRDYDSFDKINTMYNGDSFENIVRWNTYFLTKEDCQKY